MKIKNKKINKLLFGILGVSIPIILASPFLALSQKLNNSSPSENTSLFNNQSTSTFATSRATATSGKDMLEKISNNIGPVIVSGSNISSLDWYDNVNWTIDLTKYENSTTVADWEYLQELNVIYVITDKSYLLKIEANTGEILASANRATSQIPVNSNKLGFIAFNKQLYVWDAFQKNSAVKNVDTNTLISASSSNVGMQGTGETIVSLQKLSIGYNLKISTTDTITSLTSMVTNLKISFVQDNLTLFSATPAAPSINLALPTPLQFQNISTYNFYRSSTNNYMLILANKLYTIVLNEQNISASTLTEFSLGAITLKNINSAFITENDAIYIKATGDSKIYILRPASLSLSLYYDLATSTNNEVLRNAASNVSNDIQIYGVMTSDSNNYIDNQIYIGDSKSNLSTAVSNGNSRTDFLNSSTKPELKIRINQQTFYNSIPSAITSGSFQAINSDPLEANNAQITAEDYTGNFTIKAKLFKTAWYSNLASEKTITNITQNYSLKKAESKFPYLNNSQLLAIDSGHFANLIPSQLTINDFNSRANLILAPTVPESLFKNLQRTFIIEALNDSTGSITVSAIVSYNNQYGSYVSFNLPSMVYTVKKQDTAAYQFAFTSNNDPKLINLKNILPSLIDPINSTKSELNKLIDEEINYPPSRRVIQIDEANDINGTLKVSVIYNGLAPDVAALFTTTFTGFTTIASATVMFNGENNIDAGPNRNDKFADDSKSIISIPDYSGYNKLVTSDVNISMLTKTYNFTKLSQMGFNPIIKIVSPKDPQEAIKESEFGAVTISIDFSNAISNSLSENEVPFPSVYKDKFGLTDYVIEQQYYGFISIGSLYGVSLQSYDSPSIQNIVQNYAVGGSISNEVLISTISLKEFTPNELTILANFWDGQVLHFEVLAQSSTYASVKIISSFSINWAPYFQDIRSKNLIIGMVIAIISLIIISLIVFLYVWRRNKIRRYLK